MTHNQTTLDVRHMRRALRAARAGRPSPNPHVGAVVVKHGEVVATGFHRKAGEAHAEVMALRRAGSRAKGATLYVTLEPCNHHGRTPPCTEAVLEAGVKRVVVGCPDPAPHVPGAVQRLRRAGVKVTVGVCRQESEDLIADFLKHHTEALPFVTLKAAVTLDGRIATRTSESQFITGAEARKEGQRMRAQNDAVLVGIGTALADDPLLTVRDVKGQTPVRVVLDRELRLPMKSRLVQTAGEHPLWIYHGAEAPVSKRKKLERLGIRLQQVAVSKKNQTLSLRRVLRDLANLDIVRLMVEGGARVHGSFLAAGAVDRLAVFVAPMVLGDPVAIPLAYGPAARKLEDGFRLSRSTAKLCGRDILVEGWLARESS